MQIQLVSHFVCFDIRDPISCLKTEN
uniref:Uncharacterized protein n=1 Tax=Rhizophora mucronata TaxID=61149 RepID=A0A2P2PVG9_RHIMU